MPRSIRTPRAYCSLVQLTTDSALGLRFSSARSTSCRPSRDSRSSSDTDLAVGSAASARNFTDIILKWEVSSSTAWADAVEEEEKKSPTCCLHVLFQRQVHQGTFQKAEPQALTHGKSLPQNGLWDSWQLLSHTSPFHTTGCSFSLPLLPYCAYAYFLPFFSAGSDSGSLALVPGLSTVFRGNRWGGIPWPMSNSFSEVVRLSVLLETSTQSWK